jgi:hypothetical protein
MPFLAGADLTCDDMNIMTRTRTQTACQAYVRSESASRAIPGANISSKLRLHAEGATRTWTARRITAKAETPNFTRHACHVH